MPRPRVADASAYMPGPHSELASGTTNVIPKKVDAETVTVSDVSSGAVARTVLSTRKAPAAGLEEGEAETAATSASCVSTPSVARARRRPAPVGAACMG